MLKRKKKMKNTQTDNQGETIIDNQVKNEDSVTQNADNKEESEVNEVKEIDKLEELEQKLAEMNDKFLRLYSDFENFRKRTAKKNWI